MSESSTRSDQPLVEPLTDRELEILSLMAQHRRTSKSLSGVGDVITTCLSRHSRNRALGERVGRGEPLEAAARAIGQVVEGVDTTRTVVELAEREGETVPIAAEVAAVLFEGKAPAEAMNDLMLRSLKPEWGAAQG